MLGWRSNQLSYESDKYLLAHGLTVSIMIQYIFYAVDGRQQLQIGD